MSFFNIARTVVSARLAHCSPVHTCIVGSLFLILFCRKILSVWTK